MVIAGGVALCATFIGAILFDKYVQVSGVISELVKIISVFGLCLAVYVPLNLILKMEYAKELSNRVKNKLGH